ncbi:MAG: hypothetical protein MZV63_46170 [Marinilabiliales bacterium]|nr:hypothetical protein [Marinilabiliales bacterium]
MAYSGPGILDASRDIRPGDVVKLSSAGPLRREEFAAELAERAPQNPRWQCGNDPGKLLPSRNA